MIRAGPPVRVSTSGNGGRSTASTNVATASDTIASSVDAITPSRTAGGVNVASAELDSAGRTDDAEPVNAGGAAVAVAADVNAGSTDAADPVDEGADVVACAACVIDARTDDADPANTGGTLTAVAAEVIAGSTDDDAAVNTGTVATATAACVSDASVEAAAPDEADVFGVCGMTSCTPAPLFELFSHVVVAVPVAPAAGVAYARKLMGFASPADAFDQNHFAQPEPDRVVFASTSAAVDVSEKKARASASAGAVIDGA